MSRAGFIAAWAAATIIATLLAFAAVSFVVGDLTAGPRVIGTVAVSTTSTAPSSTTVAPVASSPSSSVAPSTESVPTTSQPGPTTTASTPTTSTPTTSTTIPPSSSTSTPPTTGALSDTEIVTSIGGSASVSCAGATVRLDWYSPFAGFSPEVEHAGPDEVEVYFKATTWKSKIQADCADGRVVFAVEERKED